MEFENEITGHEKNSLRNLSTKFLGKQKSVNYTEIIDKLFENYRKLGFTVSIKMHLLRSHLDRFPNNCSQLSDQFDEATNKLMKIIELRYRNGEYRKLLGDYFGTN